MRENISRRDFLRRSKGAVAGVAAAGVLGGSSQVSLGAESYRGTPSQDPTYHGAQKGPAMRPAAFVINKKADLPEPKGPRAHRCRRRLGGPHDGQAPQAAEPGNGRRAG